jgi:predicted flap endonuclease-1-like 5' DNA nuclease
MVVFLLQSLFLIAAAFVAGALLGNLFKRFSPKKDSVSENSTRAADARLASLPVLPANDDVRKSAREAAAMIPPPEPVPPEALDASKDLRKTAKKAPAKTAAKTAAKRVKNPRQDDKYRPATLKAARRGKPDALTAIEGIGNVIQSHLFALGVFHHDQIAGWSVDEATWVSEEIGFPGRAFRENWREQAAALVKPAAKTVKPAKSAKPAPAPKTPAKPATSTAPKPRAKTSRTGKSA